MTFQFDRESGTTDALLTDLYLDALLAGAILDAAAGRSDAAGGHLDPAARSAADRLRRDLVRVHPSFRFEERLAGRLAEAAGAMRVSVAAGAEGGRVVAFRGGPLSRPADDVLAPDSPPPGATPSDRVAGPVVDGAGRRVPARPLLIGGALTSAALSIAGAAFVAWRLGRPGRASTPMARAARAVRAGSLEPQPVRGSRRSSATPSAGRFD